MKKLLLLCLLPVLSLRAHADVIIVQTMKKGAQTVTITTKIKGDKSRTDVSSQDPGPGSLHSSVIVNVTTGDIITLVHESKSFIKFSPETAKALVDDLQKSKPDALAAPKIIDTGKAEKVDGRDTEIYTAATGSAQYTFWVAKDFPGFAAVQEQMRKFQVSQAAMKSKLGMKDNLAPDVWQLNGMVVKTVITNQDEEGNPVVTTMTLVTARSQAMDAADFAPPAGYEEMSSEMQEVRPLPLAPPPSPTPQQ